MNHSLPPLASTPPVPGEYGYYHTKHSGPSYRTPENKLVNFSLKEQLQGTRPWVTYHGIVPERLVRVSRARIYG